MRIRLTGKSRIRVFGTFTGAVHVLCRRVPDAKHEEKLAVCTCEQQTCSPSDDVVNGHLPILTCPDVHNQQPL